MNRFLKIFILFSFILFGLAYIVDSVITKGLQKTDLRVYQAWNDIYASNIKVDAVILGSSRAWCQYSPKILDSIIGLDFYNLGIDGHTIDYQLIRYFTYRRFCPKPKYIIHNVDFFTLNITKSGYEREQFFPYVFDDSLITQVSKVKNITFIDKNIPLIRYFGYRTLFETGVKSYFGEKHFFDGGLVKGYRGNDYNWDGSELNKIKTIKYESNLIAIKLFDNYLKKSKEEGIKIVLVFAPIYIEGAKKLVDFKSMYSLYKNLADKYNFTLLDYTYDSISIDKRNFYNAMHLNKKGSEIFSKKLANDLNAMNHFK